MSLFRPAKSPPCRGSIFFALFACVGMIGVVGVAAMNTVKGPVKAMSEITRRTIAENQMIASGKLALVVSAQQTGDCDDDGMIEPIEWKDKGTEAAPLNGGLLPATIGAALADPWGRSYGYCAWDHGDHVADPACGVAAKRLAGSDDVTDLIIAIISSGPDQRFETGCQPEGSGEYLLKVPGNDDVVLAYGFAEAQAMAGDLWNLKLNDAETATIAKNLSVTDVSGD